MRRPITGLSVCLVCVAWWVSGSAWCAEAAGVSWRGVVDHNDVIYRRPAHEGWQGLPLGNGTLGAQAWHADNGMTFQLTTALSSVYGGSLGRVRLRTTPSMTAGMSIYRQRLSLEYAGALLAALRGEPHRARGPLLQDVLSHAPQRRAAVLSPEKHHLIGILFDVFAFSKVDQCDSPLTGGPKGENNVVTVPGYKMLKEGDPPVVRVAT